MFRVKQGLLLNINKIDLFVGILRAGGGRKPFRSLQRQIKELRSLSVFR